MSDVSIASFEKVAAGLCPRTVVIAGGDREEDVALYQILREKSYVRQCLLVGNAGEMALTAERLNVELDQKDIIATDSQEQTAEIVMLMAKDDKADIIQKGNISTPILNRQLVKLRTNDTMSLVTVFEADCMRHGETMIITDPGISTVLNYSRMTGLIHNSVEIARSVLRLEKPLVALLSANEKIIPSLPSTVLANELAKAHWDDACVYGPLSFDLAVDPESVRLKMDTLPDNPALFQVAGRANVLVHPSIDAANIMYKILMSMVNAGSAAMACVTVGIKTPYIISSRSDPERSKIDSIALACIYSSHLHAKPAVSLAPGGYGATEKKFNILTVNPGSTSTKLALFENTACIKNFEIPHKHTAGLKGAAMDSEVDLYVAQVKTFLADSNVTALDAVVGRGGFLNRTGQRIEGGVYQVCSLIDDQVVAHADIISSVRDHAEMDHASNLGIPIAARLAAQFKVPAFCVDPVVADELQCEARYSGYAPIERKSTGHVLSIRACARKASQAVGRPFDKSSFILAHLGGGISIAAVRNGRIVDNSIALLGEGPFTPQRAGTLPQNELIDLCYSGRFEKDELKRELTKKAGLISYIGEDSIQVIQQRIAAGDKEAEDAVDAMIYQICKEIGGMHIAVGGAVDAIVLTGGMAKSSMIVDKIRKRVGLMAQIIVLKENIEMEAMAIGALAVLNGTEKPREYLLKVL